METNKNKFNLFKLLQNIAVIGLILVIGLVSLFITGVLPRTMVAIELTTMVGLALFGILLILPWANYYNQNRYKILSLSFLIATGICILLWEIATLIVFGALRKQTGDLGILHFVRITLFLSMQVIIASSICSCVIKFYKKYIPFQVVIYLSLAYVDFYLSTLLFGVLIQDGAIDFSTKVRDLLFFNPIVRALIILSVAYLIAFFGIISGSRRRRVRNAILAKNRKLSGDVGILDLDDEDEPETNKKSTNDAETQLEKIKTMLDKGLITQAEYDAKRKSIIDNM